MSHTFVPFALSALRSPSVTALPIPLDGGVDEHGDLPGHAPASTGPLGSMPMPGDLVAVGFAEAVRPHLLNWHHRQLLEREVLQAITASAAQLIPGADGAAILALAGPGQLHVRAAHGALSPLLLALHQDLDIDEPLPAPPVVPPQRTPTPTFNRWPVSRRRRAPGGGSMICAPLGRSHVTFGTLMVLAASDRAFTDHAESLVTVLAKHASNALAAAHRRNVAPAMPDIDSGGANTPRQSARSQSRE